VRENPGVYGCNNLSYSGTFSVVLTARGFFPDLGFSTYILCCVIVYFLSSYFSAIDVNCYELWANIRHVVSAFIGSNSHQSSFI
jgi:hypothetical protein